MQEEAAKAGLIRQPIWQQAPPPHADHDGRGVAEGRETEPATTGDRSGVRRAEKEDMTEQRQGLWRGGRMMSW